MTLTTNVGLTLGILGLTVNSGLTYGTSGISDSGLPSNAYVGPDTSMAYVGPDGSEYVLG